MAGQGSPHPVFRPPDLGRRTGGSRGASAPSGLPLCAWVLMLLCFAPFSAALQGEELDLRIRVTWGGGAARRWQTTLSLEGGKLSEPQSLATEPDAPGATWLDKEGKLQIRPRELRTFDGCDLTVRGPSEGKLRIDFATPSAGVGPDDARTVEIPLVELVSGSVTRPLDERGGQLVVRRAPGDKLRVTLERDSLVFFTGEACLLSAQPHLTGLAAGTSVRFQARLVAARGTQEFWTDQQELRVAADGSLPALGPLRVPVPQVEGAYDIILSLTRWQLRAPFVPIAADVERRVQLVAVDRQPRALPSVAWQSIREFDPSNNAWWTRLAQLTPLSGVKAPIGNQRSEPWVHRGATWLKLAPQGWQAYPLAVQQIDRPHLLEIEYPGDLPQSVGLTIVEPNAAGKVTPLAANSGWDTSPSPVALEPQEPQRRVHRFVFWPRTTAPLVLIANRREGQPAAIGTIRVLAGPAELPSPVSPLPADGRLAAAYFQRPLFPEAFSASETLDEGSRRTYDDWVTFLEAGRRYVQYLRYAGYNAAVVPVYHEGSTLYPSRLLEPTPRYDSGVFFPSGQDPVRKDVLELLLRLCDREGIRLLPAMQFAAPLPQLETLRRSISDPRREGLTWIGPEGLELHERQGHTRGLAPYYNVLDERVQQAMRQAVAELAERYKGHPSLGGITLQLGPETFAQLPSLEWGLDDRTIGRFEKSADMKLGGGDGGAERFLARSTALLKEKRAEWTDWRLAELTKFQKLLHQEIVAHHPAARLVLDTSELVRTPALEPAFRPSLPRRSGFVAAGREVGLDPSKLADAPGIILLRPTRHAPNLPLVARAGQLELAGSAEIDRAFGTAPGRGVVWFHEPQMLSLPAFAEASPFGTENTSFWQFPSLTPSDAANRKRLIHSLATLDASLCLDGGWLLPTGQEEALRDVLDTYCRLPEARFETVSPAGMAAVRGGMQPVTLRMLKHEGKTWLYLVNDSPWEVQLDLELALPAGSRWDTVGRRKLPPVQTRGEGAVWSVALAPYDLAALTCTSLDGHVRGAVVGIAPTVEQRLAERIRSLGGRIDRLAQVEPRVKLANPGFETGAAAGLLPGWIAKQTGPPTAIADLRQRRTGIASLRLENQGPAAAWVRSNPFPTPPTGRLALSCWVRIDAEQVQPSLRLAFEGRRNGVVWYKFATVGGGARAKLTDQWTQFLFHVDDLPADLNDLRVGFDLMSKGKAWVDDVQVIDLPFDENERTELLKIIAVANFQLGEGRLSDCRQTLESYWPSYLLEHVPEAVPQLARGERIGLLPRPPGPEEPPPMSLPPDAATPTILERIRGVLPAWR